MFLEELFDHVDNLILAYPGKFENLDTAHFESSDTVNLMCVADGDVIIFNEIALTDDNVTYALAFTSLMIKHRFSELYARHPNRDKQALNIAAQALIIDELSLYPKLNPPIETYIPAIEVNSNDYDFDEVYEQSLALVTESDRECDMECE